MKYLTLYILLTTLSIPVFTQNDTLKKLTISGYGEMYFSYDFSNPPNHEKSSFIYNHKRHNEVNANLILVKANHEDKNYRANIGIMAGNYAEYNLSTEPNWAQFIYEANIGIKISKQQNIWLDAGVLPSHIGSESAISADCWTLSRSLAAENSPYYETGIKLSFVSENEKLNLSTMYLNGWQRIRKPDFIQTPSFGFQATYKSSEILTLNYSNFIGSDRPDSIKSFRHFHNFYIQYQPTKKFGVFLGFDLGNEKINKAKREIWFSPVLMARQSINSKTRIASRIEYYYDKEQIIIATGTANGFQTIGVSSNIDHNINDKILFRAEVKLFQSKDKIFLNNGNKNYSITTNLSIKL